MSWQLDHCCGQGCILWLVGVLSGVKWEGNVIRGSAAEEMASG